MISQGFEIRKATINDIPFLVETIIEAEKSGTGILSWTTIFGLTEEEARKYISDMLLEEIDGCELSVSSFLVAEKDGKAVAALSAWVEGAENSPSIQLKGNLLTYILPKECIERAMTIHPIIKDVAIDYIPGSIQKGAGYVVKEFRHNNLFGILTDEITSRLIKSHPGVSQIYTQVFGCNIPAIRANEKAGFKIVKTKESSNNEVLSYLPSNKKHLMLKELSK
jgi:hypothetical protein